MSIVTANLDDTPTTIPTMNQNTFTELVTSELNSPDCILSPSQITWFKAIMVQFPQCLPQIIKLIDGFHTFTVAEIPELILGIATLLTIGLTSVPLLNLANGGNIHTLIEFIVLIIINSSLLPIPLVERAIVIKLVTMSIQLLKTNLPLMLNVVYQVETSCMGLLCKNK